MKVQEVDYCNYDLMILNATNLRFARFLSYRSILSGSRSHLASSRLIDIAWTILLRCTTISLAASFESAGGYDYIFGSPYRALLA